MRFSDICAFQKTLVLIGLFVNTADWEIEVLALAVLVGGACTLSIYLNFSTVNEALVVIGHSVFAADELDETGAVIAVAEIVSWAFSLVKNGLALASQNALILESFLLGGADWLGNGSASARTEAGGLGSNADVSAESKTLVLISDVVSSTNGSEVVSTITWDGNCGDDVVG